jgi:hypothetical protein
VLFSKTAATGHFGDTHYENCSRHWGEQILSRCADFSQLASHAC